ncbi:hypothetical protein BDV18DRAFT_162293 [Aspergillus unguis]
MLARFQLAKFSYTSTSSSHRGPLHWNHVFGNGDLVAIFEKTPAYPPGRVLFRVLRDDRDTLEEVGITDLVQEYASHITSLQDASKRPSFAVVVKPPCLAVKYPQGSTWIRRFQVKFSSDRDYYSALSILSEINCPFSEASVNTVRPMSRPTSSVSNLGQPGPVQATQRYGSTLHRLPSTAAGMQAQGISTLPTFEPSVSLITNALPSNNPNANRELSTGYLNPAIDAASRSSPPSSVTLNGTSRQISGSTTISSTYRSPLEATSSASNLPPAILEPDAESSKPLSISTPLGEQDLPPKRNLPFPKPAEKKSRTASKAADKPSLKRKASPKKAPSAKKISPIKKGTSGKSKTGPASALSEPQPVEKLVVSRAKKAEGTPSCRKAQRQLTPPSSTPPTNPIPPVQGASDNTKPISLPEINSDLARYSSYPTEQRIANLQRWFCAHLEDPGFLQLCEDLEGFAERYILGK